MPEPTTAVVAARIALECREIWGGNRRAEGGVLAPGIDAWVSSVPHEGNESGGDIHYVSTCAAGIITRFALADVSGHGHSASALAVELRNLMRRSMNTPDQTRIARALNRSFGALANAGRFATAVLASYYTLTDHLIVCNAGHPRPLWYRGGLGRWELLHDLAPSRVPTGANLPLGVIDPTHYSQFAVPLDAGDVVVMYTDSLIEAADDRGVQLGEAGLLRIASGAPRASSSEAIGRWILNGVAAHRAGGAPTDDTTILVLRHTAEDPPPLTLSRRVRVTARMLGLARQPRRTPTIPRGAPAPDASRLSPTR